MSDEKTYTESEIEDYLKKHLPHWYYENGWIRRKFKTSGLKQVLNKCFGKPKQPSFVSKHVVSKLFVNKLFLKCLLFSNQLFLPQSSYCSTPCFKTVVAQHLFQNLFKT